MTTVPLEPFRLRAVTPHDHLAVLELLFCQLPPQERQQHVERVVKDAAPGMLEGLWGAYAEHKLLGAVLAQLQPGRTATFQAPRIAAGQPLELAVAIGRRAIEQLRTSGVQIIQALLETDSGADADLLKELGFEHVSDLLYLVSLEASFPNENPNLRLQFVPCSASQETHLAAIIERTYRGSLDCPQLDGVRVIADVLEGYRAAGEFDPSRWFIVSNGTQDVGCLLLTAHPRYDQWELVYMGVVSEARGQAFGVSIARFAQWATRQAGVQRLVVAVDANNGPAVAMYAEAGFVAWDRRSVFVRIEKANRPHLQSGGS